jgi:hypothetical protein
VKLLSVYFDGLPIYRDLRKIYEESLKQTMPGVESIILEPPRPDRDRYNHKLDTAVGFKAAADYVVHNPDFYAVADIDVMWWRTIEPLQDMMETYDLMITTRGLKRKWSSGLWAVNPTPEGMQFVREWRSEVTILARRFDEAKIKRAVHPWGGIDQYAFQIVHERLKDTTNILYLPCCEWNAEVSCWHNLPDTVRMVHLYSKLRRELAGTPSGDPVLESLAERARSYL